MIFHSRFVQLIERCVLKGLLWSSTFQSIFISRDKWHSFFVLPERYSYNKVLSWKMIKKTLSFLYSCESNFIKRGATKKAQHFPSTLYTHSHMWAKCWKQQKKTIKLYWKLLFVSFLFHIFRTLTWLAVHVCVCCERAG
jgi:hypothetical protein